MKLGNKKYRILKSAEKKDFNLQGNPPLGYQQISQQKSHWLEKYWKKELPSKNTVYGKIILQILKEKMKNLIKTRAEGVNHN